MLFRFWKRNIKSDVKNSLKPSPAHTHINATFSNLGEVLGASITNSISTIVMIGGFIVLFSVVISILKQSYIIDLCSNFLNPILNNIGISINFSKPIITGCLELTNGVKQVASITSRTLSTNIILCSFLLGFGGISVMLQVYSIISKTDISIFPYIIGKFLQGVLSAFYTYIFINNFSFINLDLAPVSSQINLPIAFNNNYSLIVLFLLLTFIFLLIINFRAKKSHS